VAQAKSFAAQLLLRNSILLLQIIDDIALAAGSSILKLKSAVVGTDRSRSTSGQDTANDDIKRLANDGMLKGSNFWTLPVRRAWRLHCGVRRNPCCARWSA